MLQLQINRKAGEQLRVLCLGSHSDDIEIGCGGTILRLVEEHRALAVRWVVFGARGGRAEEARKSASCFLRGVTDHAVTIAEFRDGFFPFQGGEVKEIFEKLKTEFSPDIIFTHYRDDRHQDHRCVSDLTWNTFRDHWILEYEIPKYDGDFSSPNLYIPLDEAICSRKVNYLMEGFPSQSDKHWFSADTFMSLMRIRGMECASPFAEGFYCRKAIL